MGQDTVHHRGYAIATRSIVFHYLADPLPWGRVSYLRVGRVGKVGKSLPRGSATREYGDLFTASLASKWVTVYAQKSLEKSPPRGDVGGLHVSMQAV